MKIICFSSYPSIWFYSFAEAVVASALRNKQQEVILVTPGKEFLNRSNVQHERILRQEFNLPGYEISSVLTKKDRIKITTIMSKLTKDNFGQFTLNGLEIGKIALYEFLLNHKKSSIQFSDPEWTQCLVEIQSTLISYFACRTILALEHPDIVLLYNSLYPVNRVWQLVSTAKGIPVYTMGNGGNLSDLDQTLVIGKNDNLYFRNHLIKKWRTFRNYPLNKEEMAYVTKHFFELIKAKNSLVYSAPRKREYIDIRRHFNIKSKQTILTATMSSYDELFAAEYVGAHKKSKELIYSSQIEWISDLIEYVSRHQELFLIIRVHPRELPNKRIGHTSEHAQKIAKHFINLPDNVRINWPNDNLSLYNLAEQTNVFLNAWSTVGVEMSMLGIPVVTYAKQLIAYPTELNYTASSRKDYFHQIELAIKNGWSTERIIQAYRWLFLNFGRTIIRYQPPTNPTSSHLKSRTRHHNTTSRLHVMLQPILSRLNPIIQKFLSNRQLRLTCRNQQSYTVEVDKIIDMFSERQDSIITDSPRSTTASVEQQSLAEELFKIFSVLYQKWPSKIADENSLRYHLNNYLTTSQHA